MVKVVGGIDEAGRGPVIGPMVMAIVACTEAEKQILNKIGVKDSKQLSPAKRTKLARIIKDKLPYAIIKSNPNEIDRALRSETSSLNFLEADISGKLIKQVSKKVSLSSVMLDLPSKNKEQYIDRTRKKLKFPLDALTIKAEFKADENYVEVSAASILAKTTRDAAIKTIEKKLGFPIGSGYPADPNTIKALNEHYEELLAIGALRTEWKTIKNLLEKREQTNLNNF